MKNNRKYSTLIIIFSLVLCSFNGLAQDFMINVPGRKTTSLNGQWQTIMDWYNLGAGRGIPKDAAPVDKMHFNEYAFQDQTLTVSGDWNAQQPKLEYYEGTMWYKKEFTYQPKADKKLFVYFGAVNYVADVYLNGKLIGSHEGGFTPFQFDITDGLLSGTNKLILKVNNERKTDGIPAKAFDWWNYGGITREVVLIETPLSYIEDYFIQLKKGSSNQIEGWVKVNGLAKNQTIKLDIKEAGISQLVVTNNDGLAKISLQVKKLQLWSPENPKLYGVQLSIGAESINEQIGFRNIEVKGTEIILNGKPIFLKGINFHEEIAQQRRRATSEQDAMQLLTAAKELGCNFVRTAHYSQNEFIVRLAEKMGIMLWEEIPVWQGIQFTNPIIFNKAKTMLKEMVKRDKNRCGVIVWSLSNETAPGAERNKVLIEMAGLCRSLDATRLVSSAFDHFKYEGNKIIIDDSLSEALDVLAINKYMGWYTPWPSEAGNVVWECKFNKPMIVSEFGAEGKYGIHGTDDNANLWTEEYQEKVYRDNIAMFSKIPFLRGTCPWILYDFRTPFRMQPTFQEGWNRKGLLSDMGEKKKAWYLMKKFYEEKSQPSTMDKK